MVMVVMNVFISVAFGEIIKTDNNILDDNILYVNTKEISHEMESYTHDNFKKLMKPIIKNPELYGFPKNEVEKFKLGKAFNIYRYKNNIIESTDIFYIPILHNTNIRGFLAVTYDTESKLMLQL